MHIHRNGGNDRFHFFPSFPSFSYSKHLAEESGLRKHEIFPISLSNLFSSISNLTSQQSLAALRISNSSGREEERERIFPPCSSLSRPARLIPHSSLVSILTRRIKWKREGKKEKEKRKKREREEEVSISRRTPISVPSLNTTSRVEFAFHYNLCMRLTRPTDYLLKTGLNNTVNWPPLVVNIDGLILILSLLLLLPSLLPYNTNYTPRASTFPSSSNATGVADRFCKI